MYKLAKEYGLKYIYGCEFYICSNRFDKDKDNRYYHLTVLAKNEKGRLNINKLVSLGYLEGFYYKPRIDFELLEKHKEGLIILSGCMASEIQQSLAGGKIGMGDIEITSGNIERAKTVARRYRSVFGEDYYMEVQSHSDRRQQQLNRAIVDIAKELSIQWVTTTDSHFVNAEDQELHSVFIGINRKKDEFELDEAYNDTQLQTEEEVWGLLKPALTDEEIEIAIRNTAIISDKCNAELPVSPPLIPHVRVPDGFADEEAYLRHLCNEGWIKKGINKFDKKKRQEYKDRLMYEYEAITEMGFTGYYLMVHGYANSVKRRGIARGSGGGSLVAYLINIVDIDPIRFGLYFERFIDVSALDLLKQGIITRKELKIPDFDLDFGTAEREFVMNSIVKDHGQDHVAALGQFGYYWDKSSIKDVGRVLNIPFDVTNAITKTLEREDMDLEDALKSGVLNKWKKEYPKLFEYAPKLAGLPKTFGKHPCGKVITIDRVDFYTAVLENDGEMVVQLDMDDAGELGLVKADVLGLRTVDVIYDVLEDSEEINKVIGIPNIKAFIEDHYDYLKKNIFDSNYDDPNVLEVFRQGFTDGVFQFESDGMKATLREMQPTGLDDLGVANALYRPGSLKYIKNYVNRKHGKETFEYLHPDLEQILKVTYGIIVFQEQLIEIGRYSGMKNADLLRQATGKKDIKKLEKVKPELYYGLTKKGWTQQQMDKLWDDMLDFAKYSFNKSHSYAYAIIAYICAYMKVYHPKEFATAMFNSFEGKHDRMETSFKETKRLGVEFNDLSFRNLSPLCKLENGKITYGTTLIKHCNRQIAEEFDLIKNKQYNYFVDLLVDVEESIAINKKQLDILIKLNAFKEFGNNAYLLNLRKVFFEGVDVDGSKIKDIKYDKTHKEKTKEKRIVALRKYEEKLRETSRKNKIPQYEHAWIEREFYGYIKTSYPHLEDNLVMIVDINTKYTPILTLHRFNDATTYTMKVKKHKFWNAKDMPTLFVGDVLQIKATSSKFKSKKIDDEWVETDEVEYMLESCKIVHKSEQRNPKKSEEKEVEKTA